jgi:hypothetical protein
LEVLILRDFKSLSPEVLIPGDFKSLAPEVLILVDFKSLKMSKLQEFGKIVEVLILEALEAMTRELACIEFTFKFGMYHTNASTGI